MEVIGIGNTAQVITYDEGKVCKLFYEGYPEAAINREYENALLLDRLQLPVPRVFGIEEIDGRKGIIYERLYGKSILDHIVSGEEVEPLLMRFCDLHKTLLTKRAIGLMSYKEFVLSCSGNDKEKKAQINSMIKKLPDGDHLCHGDFHPGNAWMDLNGTVLAIDFMNLCAGPWQYDVARTYILISEAKVPNGVPNAKELAFMQKELADEYLRYMKVSREEIEPYFPLIRLCIENNL